MIAYTQSRQRVMLGPQLARGGEAVIHEVVRARDTLAKIYTARRDGYERKLKWMVQNPPDDPNRSLGHPTIAWPRELLYDANGRCIGYLMSRIHGAVKLLEVFNPRLRAQTMPNFNWRYLHRAARNLAAALDALHARDYVVGDLNESNILVMPTALVTLIDTDSFQVRAQAGRREELYACPVARAEYTPPELQGRALDKIPRQPEHDGFGLGVLIFQLLMDGSHPFRGRWLGSGDPPPIEERIRQGWFPYNGTGRGKVAALQNVLPFNALDPNVMALMERCFVVGHRDPQQRPTPEEWQEALDEAERNLIECPHRHVYAGHLSACPWCRLRRNTIQASSPSAKTQARGRNRSRPAARPTPRSSYRPTPPPFAASLPIGFGPFSQPFFYAPARPRPLRSRTTLGRTAAFAMASLRYALVVSASLGHALTSAFHAAVAFDAQAFGAAAGAVARGALISALLWSLLGAIVGGVVGLVMSLYGSGFVLSVAFERMWASAIFGAGLGLVPGAIFGALLESIASYRETGGALIGAAIGAALAMAAPASSGMLWQNFLMVGAIVGAMFALTNLAVVGNPGTQRLALAPYALKALATWLKDARGWLALGLGAAMGMLVSAFIAFVAVPSVNLALMAALSIGFVAGTFAATRRPAKWP